MKPLSNIRYCLIGLIALVALAPAAQAHHEAGTGSSFVQGLLHPLTGLDHLLATLAVGLWASQRGGRSQYGLPIVFLAALVIGNWFGTAGFAMPFAESGILFSIMALGLLVGAAANPTITVSTAIVGLFAMCHGYAHGVERPLAATPVNWVLGFTLSTVAVLIGGIALGQFARMMNRGTLVRWAGGLIAACGFLFLIA